LENPIKALRQYITHYLNLRFQEFRLEALERIVNVMGYLIMGAVAFFLIMVMFGFAAFGLAEWLCYVFNSRTLGYFTVSAVILLLLILLFLFRRNLFRMLGGKILWILTKSRNDDKEEEKRGY